MANDDYREPQQAARAGRDVKTFGGGPHTFTITVNLRGHGCNYADDLVPQAVEAYSLVDALHKAAELPLYAWFPSEEDEA